MVLEGLYRDTAASTEARVADLLSRMTLAEKLAQLGSVWAFSLVSDDGIRQDRLTELVPDGIGEITRLLGSTNLRAEEAAPIANGLQRYLVEETRLGIPAIIHEECIHGVLAWGAPCFQQSIGAAATFDPELVEQVAGTFRARLLAAGARHALAPVLDIGRDPRWGRIEETYGEDPYLAAVMGVAYVRGLQGDDRWGRVLATGKHLVGHAISEGGLNQAPAHAGLRELRDEQLLPFEAAIVEANLRSIMPTYCEFDGVPCHVSRELLDTLLRGEWGFDGLVSSDYLGIEQAVTQHHLTSDMSVAAKMALEAGVDQELPRTLAYGEPLAHAIETGALSESLVDRAAARVLRAKVDLGLFERPYTDEPSRAFFTGLVAQESQLARRLAQRSIVLLENDGVLPLAPAPKRVAVIGPIADSARELLGDYSHLVHIETLRELRARDDWFGTSPGDEVALEDELSGRRSILAALRERLTGAEVSYARGCGISDGTDAELDEAVRAAADADVALLVVGERSGLTVESTTGEFRDRMELTLIGRQQELVERVLATGTPVVLLVVSGRPLVLEAFRGRCAAIVLCWVPGDAGADAIADVLVGDENPSGKLPMAMPRSVGQVPLNYRHHPSGGRSNPRGDYVDGPATPSWPFGFGRSYTSFALRDLELDRTVGADRRRGGARPGVGHEHRRSNGRRDRAAVRA